MAPFRNPTVFGYEPFNQIESIQHKQGSSSTLLSSQTNVWNNFQLTSKSSVVAGGTAYVTTYSTFDDLQLDHETTTHGGTVIHDRDYFWDDFGNPADAMGPSIYIIGSDDRLEQDYDWVYEYDANGSLTKKTPRVGGAYDGQPYEEYTWNHRGKMKTAKAFTTTGTLLWTEEYRYDAAGRNIHTIHTEAGQSPTEKFSIYDGFDLYSLVMEMDGDERITMNAMHAPAVDMVLAEDRLIYDSLGNVTDHDVTWPLGDHQNSPVAVATTPTGTNNPPVVTGETIRSAFGSVIAGASTDSSFGFQGHVNDTATGQSEFRNRNFSAQQGRFISQDPIRFASGQTNHYQFVGNHPHMGTDPSGLAEDYRNNFARAVNFIKDYELRGAFNAILGMNDSSGALWEAHHWYSQNEHARPWIEKMSPAINNVDDAKHIALAPKHIHTEITTEQIAFWSRIGQEKGLLTRTAAQSYKNIFGAIEKLSIEDQKAILKDFESFVENQKSNWKTYVVQIDSTTTQIGNATYNVLHEKPAHLPESRAKSFFANRTTWINRNTAYVDRLPKAVTAKPPFFGNPAQTGAYSDWGKWGNRALLALGLYNLVGTAKAVAAPDAAQSQAFDDLIMDYRNAISHKANYGYIGRHRVMDVGNSFDRYLRAMNQDNNARGILLQQFYRSAMQEP